MSDLLAMQRAVWRAKRSTTEKIVLLAILALQPQAPRLCYWRSMGAQRADVEAQVRQAWDKGDFLGATTLALQSYGPEVLGFLINRMKEPSLAEQAFSLFGERLWRGMQDFEWRSSIRTWAYVLANHAAADVHRDEAHYRKDRLAFSSDRVGEIAEIVRTETISLFRTDARNAFAEIRGDLPPEDRALLVLRYDRKLEWLDIARIFGAAESDLTRESGRLRQRLQLIKKRLRGLGKDRGLA